MKIDGYHTKPIFGGSVPAVPSLLIDHAAGESGGEIAADPRVCMDLSMWLALVTDPRSHLGRWHPLTVILGVAVCAMTAAGNDSPTAIGEWVGGASQEVLAALGARFDPWQRRYRGPSARTVCRTLGQVDGAELDAMVGGYLAERARRHQAGDQPNLPEQTLAGREQRRVRHSVNGEDQPAEPDTDHGSGGPDLLAGCAADGKVARGAVRADGSRVNLLGVMDTEHGTVLAQREIHAKTNEIPELAPAVEHLNLTGRVVTMDALHTQRETARHLVEDKHAHYLMIIKGNQPSLLEAASKALTGKDEAFTDTTHTTDDRGHGRRERRSIRTAPADGIDFPHAAQVLRIHRRSGGLTGPWLRKEIVYGITDLTPDLAGPTQIATYARNHWGIENKIHYVRDVTFGEDSSQVRTGNLPRALASIRNLIIGTPRLAGYANIAHARRHHGRDDTRTLDLFKYRHPALN